MIILMGIKHSGKTSLGRILAVSLNLPFWDLDILLEEQYSKDRKVTFRELYQKLEESGFRELETKAMNNINLNNHGILALGGGTIDNQAAMKIVKKAKHLVFLDTDEKVLYRRIKKNGLPSFLEKSPEKLFHNLFVKRRPLYLKAANTVIKTEDKNPEEILEILLKKIGDI